MGRTLPLGQAVCMSQYVPFEEVRRTEFFEDCCKPLDMFHVMGSSLDLS